MSDAAIGTGSRSGSGALTMAGAASILVAGLIHLVLTPQHFEEATYLGVLFAADFVGASLAAFGILRGHRWGWILGALIAGGAFVAYVLSETAGLPGVAGGDGHSIGPVGIITKEVEALFLVLCVFALTRSRRWALGSGIVAALAVTVLAVLGLSGVPAADDSMGGHHKAAAKGGGEQKKGAGSPTAGLPVRWKATSPAIHEGDRYTIVVKNTGEEEQQARITAEIMDHSTQTNTTVIDEVTELASGEERQFEAVNDYGTADHFVTRARSANEDLSLQVNIVDDAGAEVVRFSEKAFLVWEGPRNLGG